MKKTAVTWVFVAIMCQLTILATAGRTVRAAGTGNVPPRLPVQSYRSALVHTYVWSGEAFAIGSSGKYAAVAVAGKGEHTAIYFQPLMEGHGVRWKIVDFPARVSGLGNEMCWSRTGRYLAICGIDLLGIVDMSTEKPTLKTVPINWVNGIFFQDESVLLGMGLVEDAQYAELQQIELAAPKLVIRRLPDYSVNAWSQRFVALDDNTIALVGSNLRVRRDGSSLKGEIWGNDSLYGMTAGPVILCGKTCVIDLKQPAKPIEPTAKPHGPYGIVFPYATYLNAYSINGQHLAHIEWPKDKSIASVYPATNGRLFVQLEDCDGEKITLYEYQLSPM